MGEMGSQCDKMNHHMRPSGYKYPFPLCTPGTSGRTFKKVKKDLTTCHMSKIGSLFEGHLGTRSKETMIWSLRSQRQDLRSSVDFFNLLGCDVETRSRVDGCCEGRGWLGDVGRMFVLDLIVCILGQHCIKHTAT